MQQPFISTGECQPSVCNIHSRYEPCHSITRPPQVQDKVGKATWKVAGKKLKNVDYGVFRRIHMFTITELRHNHREKIPAIPIPVT